MANLKANHDVEAQENKDEDVNVTNAAFHDMFDFRNDDMVNSYIKFHTDRQLRLLQNNTNCVTTENDNGDMTNDNNDPPPIDKQTLLSLIVVYFSVFLDDMGVSIVSPILPFYAAKFGANSIELGILLAIYQLFMAFSSYIMGKLSDKYGRRKLILYSLFGTMTGFTITGFSFNYLSLVIFRAITGCFGGSRSIANAYITDVVPRAQRTKYLAFTSLAMSFAFIIGPLIGSSLSIWSIRIPFFVSGGLGATGLGFAYFVVLESPHIKEKIKKRKENKMNNVNKENKESEESKQTGNTRRADDKKTDETDKTDKSNTTKVAKEMDQYNPKQAKRNSNIEFGTMETMQTMQPMHMSDTPKQILAIGVNNILNLTCFASFSSMFAFYAILKFDISTLGVGYIILITAVTMVFTTILLLNPCHKAIGPYFTSFIASIIMSTFLGLIPVIGKNNLYLAAMCAVIGAGLGAGLGYPSSSVMAVEYTNIHNRGKIMAFNEMTVNLGQVIGPIVHGVVFSSISPNFMFYLGGVYGICAAILTAGLIITNPNTRTQCNRYKNKYKYKNKKSDGDDDNDDENNGKWRFTHDEPKSKDYKKLGIFLGDLLIERNYNWVSHWHIVAAYLKESLPPVRTDSLEIYVEDLMYLRSQVIGMRNEYDLKHPQI